MTVETLVPAVIALLVACVGFFVARAIGRVDTSQAEIWALRESLGVLKSVNEAQWRKLDKAEAAIQQLTSDVSVLKHQMATMEKSYCALQDT